VIRSLAEDEHPAAGEQEVTKTFMRGFTVKKVSAVRQRRSPSALIATDHAEPPPLDRPRR
jgi:hypothetical protein